MRKISKRTGPRLLLALLVAVIGLSIYVASTTEAEAVVIAGPSVCAYYSDATYTTVVGARGTGCCGQPISWGVTSPFVKCQRLYCTTGNCGI